MNRKTHARNEEESHNRQNRLQATDPGATNWRQTDSGLEIAMEYGPTDLQGFNDEQKLGDPGKFPYTRGIYPTMYRGRLWTMRQYAGYATPEETNRRFRYLLEQGQTGLSVAFDLPTQTGYDSDHQLARGEVGKVGVPIDTLDDMETVFSGIPLDQVTTSMTINSTAPVLLALYIAAGGKQGVPPERLGGTVQNDILKEYIARGTYIYPPQHSMRLVTDIFKYCAQHLPQWNTISVSGYHMREAGANAVQELAFTFANGIAYVDAAIKAGLDVDEFAPRISFFFAAQNNLLEEVAKFRAARRMWATIMRDRYKAKDPRSYMLRFHTQTAGVSLTAQQPDNNIVRTTIQALAAVLGGTQSLHVNSKDEALALPTEDSARLSLRTQQIIANESGVADIVDPLAGSYYGEWLTDRLEEEAWDYMSRIENLGGALAAIEEGLQAQEIHEVAYRHQQDIESADRIVVGVNKFRTEEPILERTLRIDPNEELNQISRLNRVRAGRDGNSVKKSLRQLEDVARGTENTMPAILECTKAYASIGEICDALRGVFGEQREFGNF